MENKYRLNAKPQLGRVEDGERQAPAWYWERQAPAWQQRAGRHTPCWGLAFPVENNTYKTGNGT